MTALCAYLLGIGLTAAGIGALSLSAWWSTP